jgi:pentatricopeptide repeat protein
LASKLLTQLEQHATLEPDSVSYHTMITALTKSGQWEDALAIPERMRQAGEFTVGIGRASA